MPPSAGCFSWVRLKKLKPKPRTVSENYLDPESSGVVPSTGKYVFDAGKQTIQVLRRFSNALPVPCANEVLGVALLLMTTYEEVTVIEEQVRNLNNRIGSLMLIMVDELSGKEAISISGAVCQEIERLGSDLGLIQKDLKKMTSQSRWLLLFFKNANKSTIDGCISRLNNALQSFHITRTIHDGNALFEVQNRLQKMSETTEKMANQVNDMHSWLMVKNAHNAPRLILEEMPPVLAHMYGRFEVINNIVHVVTTEPAPRVAIHGAGGMGKTSVAVSVMEDKAVGRRYDAACRFWVPCIGATSPIVFLQILSKCLCVTQDTGDLIKDILKALKASEDPRLILLDNFETALSLTDAVTEGGRISVEDVLNLLASIPHVAILITIRANTFLSDNIEWRLVPLGGVARDDARAIFTGMCPSLSDHPALDPLLEALGDIPYAITLMAKQARLSNLGPDVLLEEWQRSGPNSLSGDLKLKMNRSIGYSVESAAITQNPDAQTLLAILSRLPSGTNIKNLTKWWARNVTNISGAIGALNGTALIAQRSGESDSVSTLFVLPVVQSYLNEQSSYNSPTTRCLVLDACCKFVLEHKSSPGDDNFRKHVEALTVEKTNIQSILLAVTTASFSEPGTDNEVSAVFDAMLAFSWYQFWTQHSTELLKHLIELSPLGGDAKGARYIAEARFCLGKMYINLGRHKEGCHELEVARAAFRKLGTSSDIVRAGDCAPDLAEAWCWMMKPRDEILNLVTEAQADLQHDPKGEARGLLMLGITSRYMFTDTEALKTLKTAKGTLKELNCTLELVQCLLVMSRCYASQKMYTEWKDTAEETLRLSRQIGVNDIIAQALRTLSRCHIQVNEYDNALAVLKEALSMTEQLGQPLAVAQVLEMSGYAYAMKHDFVGARLAYERAKAVYSDMEKTSHTTRAEDSCGRNIEQIAQSNSGDIKLDAPMLY